MPKQLRDIVVKTETPHSINPEYSSEGDTKFIDLHKIEVLTDPAAEPGQFSGEIQGKKKEASDRHGYVGDKKDDDKKTYKKVNEAEEDNEMTKHFEGYCHHSDHHGLYDSTNQYRSLSNKAQNKYDELSAKHEQRAKFHKQELEKRGYKVNSTHNTHTLEGHNTKIEKPSTFDGDTIKGKLPRTSDKFKNLHEATDDNDEKELLHPMHHALIKAGFKHTGNSKDLIKSQSYEAPPGMTREKLTSIARKHGLEGKASYHERAKPERREMIRGNYYDLPAKKAFHLSHYYDKNLKTKDQLTFKGPTIHVDHGEDKKTIKNVKFKIHEANNIGQLKAKMAFHRQGAEHAGEDMDRYFKGKAKATAGSPTANYMKNNFKKADRKYDLHNRAEHIARKLIRKKQQEYKDSL